MRKSSRIVLGIALLSVAFTGGAFAQATRLVVRTAAGDSTVTRIAGTTQSLKISALTAAGAVDVSYAGPKSLTFSGASSSPNPATAPTVTNSSGSAISFGSPTSITFTLGVATVSGSNNGVMALYCAESAIISATAGTLLCSGTDRLSATVENTTLDKFSWSLASPQTNAAVFIGTNTLTAQDQYGNPVTTFNALSNNVTVTTSLSGTISGLGGLNTHILNQAADFTNGVTNLTSTGMKFTGIAGTGTFTATSATGSKTGTSASVQIVAAPATRLVLRTATGDSVISLQAGTTQNLRITALDANGNQDLTYTGQKSLTFSGASVSPGSNNPTVTDLSGNQIAFGTATPITFANGAATVSGGNNGVMRLYCVQASATVSVTDGSISSTGTNALTATVSPGALSRFAWSLQSPQTSGVAFAGTNTLTAQDAYENTCTSFDASTNPVTVTANAPLSGTITGLGSGSNNILNQVGDFSSGVASLSSKMIYSGASGTGAFTATATGATNASSSITINAGTATRLVVRTVAGDSVITVAAGIAKGLKITAFDASGNIATGYTGTKTLRFFGAAVSADSKAPTVSDNTGTERDFSASVNTPLDFTNGVATAGGANGMMRLRKVETSVLVGASDGSITTATADRLTATVTPAGLGRFTVSLTPSQVNATVFTGVNTVTAIDSFGNAKTNFDASTNNVTVTTTLTGTVSGLGSAANNVLNQSSDFSSGVANVTNKIKFTGTVGSGTFTATSATGKTGTSGSVTVNVGSATRFVITGSSTQLAGATQNLTITAKDSSGNTATGYSGDKLVKFSGSTSSPSGYDPKVTDRDGTQNLFGAWLYLSFSSGVAQVSGSANGVLLLYRAGKDTISVVDNGGIGSGSGDRLVVTVTEDVLQKFVFVLATPQQSGIAFKGTNTLTAQDQYGNTVTTFNPAADNVTVSANSPLSGPVTGLGSGSNNILNQASDFSSGIANLTDKMIFTGGTGTAPFTAVSASSKSGTSGNVQIVAGGATRLVISGVTSMTAGGTQSLTITAKDASGNTVTSYTGLKTLTFDSTLASSSPSGSAPTVSNSSGAAITFGNPTGINFASGVATVSGSNNGVLRLYKTQTAIIAATDGTISASGADRLTVTVSPAALGRFAWSLTSPQTNGVAFIGTNTLTAQDDYWNTVTSFDASTSNVALSTSLGGTITGLGSISNNVLNRSGDFISGVANLTTLGMKYTGATGSGTFTATSGGKTTTSSTIQIVAGSASRLVLRVAGGDSVITLSAGDSKNLVITAKDASGNTVTSYTDDKVLTFSGADSSASPATAPTVSNSGGAERAFGISTTIKFTNGVAIVTGSTNGVMKLYKAQSAVVSVTDGTRSSTGSDRLTVTVNPAALDNFKWVLFSPQVNGGAFTGTNTLTARDAYGNVLAGFDASANNVTISTTLTGTVSGLGSGSNNILNRSTDFVSGVADLTSMGMKFTGTIGTGTFTATSAGKAGTSSSVEITPGGATRLVITGSGTQTAGTSQTLTITAKDASGNTVPTYTGLKTLTFSGANVSTIPVTAPTVSNNAGADVAFGTATSILFTSGVANGVLKLYKVETATVAATDGSISATGSDRLTVAISPAALGKFAWSLTDPQTNGTAFVGTNTLSAQDDWGNIVPTFDASTDNVTLTTSLSTSTTAITGLGTLSNNVLNQASNFVLGVANLTSLGMKYTGPAGKGVFIARSTLGSKSGVSDSITVGNPAPTITGISPTEANRRQSVLVTVTGTKFIPGSTILNMGTDVTVDSIVVLSSTQLTARILPGINAVLGLRNVGVSNAGPGGGTDSILNAFTVKNIPSITNLVPSSGVRGQTYQVLITGTNFAEGVSVVGVQGTGITVNNAPVTSPTTINASITISPSATDGVRPLHVENADPYGGRSNSIGFTVGANPIPDVTSVTPATAKRGSSVTLTLKGSHFYNGITSASLGQGVIITGVTIDTVTQMRVTATITDTATTGARNLVVTNSTPGGGSDTLKNGFTIENPEPTLTGLSVQNASRLQTVNNLILTGSQFIRNVTTVSAGNNIAVSGLVVDSSTSLRVSLTVDSSAVLGPRDITVTNPVPGGGSASIQDALTINNPLPTLASIAPESTKVGGTGFTLTVAGTNFVPGIVVQLGGRSLTTTLVNRTRITAAVLPSDIDTARSLVVAVFAPLPGGGTSNTKNLIIQNPLPTLTGISPASASKLQTLDVTFTGTNFLPGVTEADFGGSDIVVNGTMVTDSAHLVANITVSATATMGARDVFVRNPAPGGGDSEKKTFTVAENPKPTITALDPNSWYRLGAVDVTITGSNFIDGVTTANFGPGTVVNGMFVINSPTSLTAGVTISATAATGWRAVSVSNAEPGGGTATFENAFNIVNPLPKLDYVYPASMQAGQTDNVTFYGEGFIDGVSSVNMGTGITINEQNVLSDTVIIANITITLTAATGARTIYVNNNPPGGGQASLASGFYIGDNPKPTLVSIEPTSARRLETLDIVFHGTNFVSGVTSVNLGSGITVNLPVVDSSNTLTANVTISGTAATGSRTVYVVNAPPGGGIDSLLDAFIVTNPVPTLTSVNPASAKRAQTLNVVLRGTNFVPATTPSFGTLGDITINSVTIDSARQMTANITVGEAATLGARSVTVANPSPGGGTSGSVAFGINLAPPPAPTLLSPSNGATNLPVTLVLKWDSAAGATQYTLQLSTSVIFLTTLVDDSSISGRSRQVGPLTNSQTYYWRVRARNGGGTSEWSSTWGFTPLYPDVYPLSYSLTFPSYATASQFGYTDYRIVGLPGAGTTLIGNYLTGTQGTDWQVYADNGASSGYWVPYNSTSEFIFSAGKAYWLIKKNPWTVNTSVPTAPLDTSVAVRILLHTGWNLVTNPFLHSLPWSSVQEANSPSAQNPIWAFGGVNGFAQSTTLEPYAGYYFLNTSNVSYLRIPYGATSGVWRKIDSASVSGWTVTVAAQTEGYTDRALSFGVRDDAAEGYDMYDYQKPRGIGSMPSMAFRRPEFDSVFSCFATDFRPAVETLTSWPFELSTPEKNPVALQFGGLGQVPEELEVYLIDYSHERSVNLRSEDVYQYKPPTPVGQFAVAVGTHSAMETLLESVGPKEFGLDNNFPNPFNPSTTLPVAVPHSAMVDLKIYNLLGQEVRTVFAGQLDAGRHWIVWDGRNNAGAGVASGVYIARLSADPGVSVVKKLLLMK